MALSAVVLLVLALGAAADTKQGPTKPAKIVLKGHHKSGSSQQALNAASHPEPKVEKSDHLSSFLKDNPKYTLKGKHIGLPEDNKKKKADASVQAEVGSTGTSKRKINTPTLDMYRQRYAVGRDDKAFQKTDDLMQKYFARSILPPSSRSIVPGVLSSVAADNEKQPAGAHKEPSAAQRAFDKSIKDSRDHKARIEAEGKAATAAIEAQTQRQQEQQKVLDTISQERALLGLAPVTTVTKDYKKMQADKESKVHNKAPQKPEVRKQITATDHKAKPAPAKTTPAKAAPAKAAPAKLLGKSSGVRK